MYSFVLFHYLAIAHVLLLTRIRYRPKVLAPVLTYSVRLQDTRPWTPIASAERMGCVVDN